MKKQKRPFTTVDSEGNSIDWLWFVPGMVGALLTFAALVLIIIYAAVIDVHIRHEPPYPSPPFVPSDNVSDVDFDLFRANATLFVSPVWPSAWVNLTSPTYFTNITDAISQARKLLPASSALVKIVIFPGTYAEDLILPSNLLIQGSGDASLLTGSITWTPGAGINVNLTATNTELLFLDSVVASGTFRMDSSSKSGPNAFLFMTDCILTGSVNLTMISESSHRATITDTSISGQLNMLSCNLFAYHCVLGPGASIVDGGSEILMYGYDIRGSLVILGISFVTLSSVTVEGSTNLTHSHLTARACDFQAVITSDSTSNADIRTSEWVQLSGAGLVTRTYSVLTATPTINGTNVVTLSPPYGTITYAVFFTQTASTANRQYPIVTAKTFYNFTYFIQDSTNVQLSAVISQN